MLTIADDSTIRHAIWKRLVTEPGVILHKFDDIGIRVRKDKRAIEIQVRPLVQPIPGMENAEVLRITAAITAPLAIHHSDLLNEVDQVAEQIKAARRDYLGIGHSILTTKTQLAGRG